VLTDTHYALSQMHFGI